MAANNQYPESVYMAVASTKQVATGMTGELGTDAGTYLVSYSTPESWQWYICGYSLGL